MIQKKYVIMMRDECGDACRAYGDNFLKAVHVFTSYADEEAEVDEEYAQQIWDTYDDEDEICDILCEARDEAIKDLYNEQWEDWAWMLIDRAHQHWAKIGGGDEVSFFIERLHSDISLREWQSLGYGDF